MSGAWFQTKDKFANRQKKSICHWQVNIRKYIGFLQCPSRYVCVWVCVCRSVHMSVNMTAILINYFPLQQVWKLHILHLFFLLFVFFDVLLVTLAHWSTDHGCFPPPDGYDLSLRLVRGCMRHTSSLPATPRHRSYKHWTVLDDCKNVYFITYL